MIIDYKKLDWCKLTKIAGRYPDKQTSINWEFNLQFHQFDLSVLDKYCRFITHELTLLDNKIIMHVTVETSIKNYVHRVQYTYW